jgi:hypothetical protein
VQLVLELVLHLVARADVARLREEVGDVVRAAELERDDVVDPERLAVGLASIPYSISTACFFEVDTSRIGSVRKSGAQIRDFVSPVVRAR